MRSSLNILLSVSAALCLLACRSAGGNNNPYLPQPGQGQYVRPAYLEPELPRRLAPDDLCQARVYQSLIGQYEGSLYFQAIPGRKRIVKPANLEQRQRNFLPEFEPAPPLLEVREFLSDQPLYAPSIRTSPAVLALEPEVLERLTIEIGVDGIVEDVRCG